MPMPVSKADHLQFNVIHSLTMHIALHECTCGTCKDGFSAVKGDTDNVVRWLLGKLFQSFFCNHTVAKGKTRAHVSD